MPNDAITVGDMVRVWWTAPVVEVDGWIIGEVIKATATSMEVYYEADDTTAIHHTESAWTIEKIEQKKPAESDSDDDLPLMALRGTK